MTPILCVCQTQPPPAESPLTASRGRAMVELIKDRTAIVGIGQTRFGKGIEDTELSLACQAVSAAIDDAGLSPSEVDGLAMFAMENSREVDLARSVGLGDITYFGEIGYGGGAAGGTVRPAGPAGGAAPRGAPRGGRRRRAP